MEGRKEGSLARKERKKQLIGCQKILPGAGHRGTQDPASRTELYVPICNTT